MGKTPPEPPLGQEGQLKLFQGLHCDLTSFVKCCSSSFFLPLSSLSSKYVELQIPSCFLENPVLEAGVDQTTRGFVFEAKAVLCA